MTALALSTKRLTVCPHVLVLPYHHPVRLAKGLATLDLLCNGRLIVAVGVGWYEEVFRALNLPFKQRGAMSDEYLRAMKELWTSDRPSFHGRYVSFEGIRFEPRPLQVPHPPLVIGGYSRRALLRAAELGDGATVGGRSWEQLKEDLVYLRGNLAERGRDFAMFRLLYQIDYAATHPGIANVLRLRGLPPAPPLSLNSGEAVEQVAGYAALGFTHLVVRFPGTTAQEVQEEMQSVRQNVIEPSARILGSA